MTRRGAGTFDSADAFRQPILIIRWGTAAISLALSTAEITGGDLGVAGWLAVVVGIALFRTRRPIRAEPALRRTVSLTTEGAVVGVACVATGFFESPFVFSTLAPVAIAGFLGGFAISLRLAGALALAIGVSWAFLATEPTDVAGTSVQWGGEMLLVGVVASYARRISSEADERRTEALDRLGRLGDANELLYSLHQVAQELPSSLDLDEVLDSTLDRLRDLIDVETAAVVVYEESDRTWSVARRFGARLSSTLPDAELPAPIVEATAGRTIVSIPNLLRAGGPGLSPRASSGLYAPLVARGALVGALVVEHTEPSRFDARDVEVLTGFAEPAALAIDNARWFARLRTVGADEERTRIARDLHDRIGQSLAYLAFELDRIVRKDERGVQVSDDLDGLRNDVRDVVREVRDTLYDLRTDVSDERTVGEVLEEFAERVRDRSGMTVVVRVDESERVPRLQERELWRIAQEAIVNAERHSRGSRIDVFWFANGSEAVAEIRDDGVGMPAGHVGRLDSYGMLGMRERASSIGASLSVESLPKRGVTVRAALTAAS